MRWFSRRFYRGASTVGVANMCGANLPATVPGIGAKICSYLFTKVSAAFCLCSSGMATWALGIIGIIVAGHVALAIVG